VITANDESNVSWMEGLLLRAGSEVALADVPNKESRPKLNQCQDGF
jgi:hypothetical protein